MSPNILDPLADILSGIPIRTALFTRLDASAPWGIHSSGDLAIKFVLLVRGSAILTTAEHPEPIALGSGDVFIMMNDQSYRLFDHQDSLQVDCVDVEKLRQGHRIAMGGGGNVTSFISGFFDLDSIEAAPLLGALPPLLHLKLDKDRSLAFQSVLELLAWETESPGLGSDAVIRRLFELLFIHAIRHYSSMPGGPKRGWLAALRDRHLARAVAAIHGDPSRDWTVDALAVEAGMSRSGFALRFKTVVQQTPLEYLTQWRMVCAARMLRDSDLALADVSRQVGYESVAAFTRVFRRELATTPGAFRKNH